MPNLTRKGSSDSSEKKQKPVKQKRGRFDSTAAKVKKSKQQNANLGDEVVIAGVTPTDEVLEEELKRMPAVERATPFSDGIIASGLRDLVVISRVGGQEVEVIRSFLRYFGITETSIDFIITKCSFMKKKGGILL